MSIYIKSKDRPFSTPFSYDGYIVLNTSLSGTYTLASQWFEPGKTIPWIWTGVNTLDIGTYDILDPTDLIGVIVNFNVSTLQGYSSMNDIATYFVTTINAALNFSGANLKYKRIANINTSNPSQWTVSFDNPVNIKFNSPYSTINEIWGYEANGNGAEDFNATTFFDILTKYMMVEPEELELHVEESSSSVFTSHGTYPTLILATSGGAFEGQIMTFLTSTKQISFTIYAPHVSLTTCPISNEWSLIFRKY